MDETVSKKRPGRGRWRRAVWIICGVLIIAIVVWAVRALTGADQQTAHKAPPAIPVTAATAARQNFAEISDNFGNVQSIDAISVLPRVTGNIEKIEFTPGQNVKAGQELFLIDPRPYQAALDEAKGQLLHDQGALAEAKVDLGRYQKLLSQDSISQQTEEDQLYAVQQDQGTVQLDQANVATARLNLQYCHITAPISGRAGVLEVDLGNLVGSGSGASSSTSSASTSTGQAASGSSAATNALVSITQLQPIYVTFSIPQTLVSEVLANQAKAPLEVAAFSQDGKLLAKGQLDIIDNQVNTATGTLTLQARFANSGNVLWPGEYVSVELTYGTLRNVVTVPSDAIMVGPDGDYVYVIGSGNKVKRVDVEETATQNGVSVIAKGVAAGETVVTTGQYSLTDGSVVAVQPATASDSQAQDAGDAPQE